MVNVEEKVVSLEDMITRLVKIQEQTEREISKLTESITEINKQWGGLSNKLGTIVEDFVAYNILTIAKKYFNLTNVNLFMVRPYKTKPRTSDQRKEFDVIAVYDDKVILNETKATPRISYIDDFIKFIEKQEFYEYFPEYKNKTIIPIFSSLYIQESTVKYLTKNKIFAMAGKGDLMNLLNFPLT